MKHLFALFFALLLFSHLAEAQLVFPVKQDGKWGLIDKKGEIFLSPTYDAIGKMDAFGYAIIQTKDKIGIINQNGQVVLSPRFQGVKVIDNGLFAVQEADHWTIINAAQQPILTERYSKIELLENGAYLRYSWKDKYGLVTREGKRITVAQYDAITPSSVGTFYIKKGHKVGIINLDGKEILPAKFDKATYEVQNFIFVQNENSWGIFDGEANVILPIEWDSWNLFSDHIIRITKKGKIRLYNFNTRKFITDKEYHNYIPYSDTEIIVRKGREIGLINIEGREILSCEYTEIQPFSANKYRVEIGRNWGIVAKNDAIILPVKYDFIAPLEGSVTTIINEGKFGIINIEGEIVLPIEYTKINIEDNLAKAYKGIALSILSFDTDGKLKNEYNYKKVGSIKVGRSMRRRSITRTMANYQIGKFEWYHDAMQDRWGLRNVDTGEDQIPPSYDMISIHRDLGFTIVGKKAVGRFQIDRTEFRFDQIYGIVNNEQGLLVTEMNIWDIRLEDFKQQKLPAARVIFTGGSHGLMAKNGKILQKDLLFIGDFEDGLTRFSKKGQLSVTLTKNNVNFGKLGKYLGDMLSANGMSSVTLFDQELVQQGTIICKDCLWGFMDTLGRIPIPPQYDFARKFKNEVAVVQLENDWGLINKDGQTILKCAYNDVEYLENSDSLMIQVLVKKEKIGLIDNTGKVIIPAIYTDLGEVSEGRVAVKSGGKWGFCDLDGNEIIDCKYEKVHDFSEGLAAFCENRKWGFLDANGNIIIENKFKKVGKFKKNLAPVSLRYDYQYIDKTGEIVIEITLKEAFDFENGVARVKYKNDWALMDLNGNFIYKSSKYLKILPFNEDDLAIVQMGNNKRYYGVINQKGEKLTRKRYDKILPFTNGFAVVKTSNGYGFINRFGKEVIKTEFMKVASFSENIAAVQIDGKWGYMDTLGNMITPTRYSKVLSFQDGFGVIYKGYKYSGLVNTKGEFAIVPNVNRILAFSEGKGLIRNPKYQYSFITKNNKLSKGFFQDALPYQNGVAIIKKEGRWGLLTQQGVEIVPPKYDKIEPFENGYARIKIKSFKGVTDLEGNFIVEPNYEYITYWGNGIFRVENGDKLGYFNIEGDWIWAME